MFLAFAPRRLGLTRWVIVGCWNCLQECVLCILLLAFVLTGSIGQKQKRLMKLCCEVINDTKAGEKRVHYYQVTAHCTACHRMSMSTPCFVCVPCRRCVVSCVAPFRSHC